jgi:hypothetical protein
MSWGLCDLFCNNANLGWLIGYRPEAGGSHGIFMNIHNGHEDVHTSFVGSGHIHGAKITLGVSTMFNDGNDID